MFSAFQNISLPFSETVDIRVPNRNFREFSLFNVDFICASATNAIDKDTYIFNRRSVSVNDWLVSDIFTIKFRNGVISDLIVNLTCVFIYIYIYIYIYKYSANFAYFVLILKLVLCR